MDSKGWGQIPMLLQIKIYLSDLGITWHSCSGMYPEAIAQVIPKSVCGSCSNPHGTTLGGDKITPDSKGCEKLLLVVLDISHHF